MTIYNVLKTLTIGNNTAVVVEGPGELLRNGIGILDENGKPYEVLSVGMDNIDNTEDLPEKTSLLLNGSFISNKMYV